MTDDEAREFWMRRRVNIRRAEQLAARLSGGPVRSVRIRYHLQPFEEPLEPRRVVEAPAPDEPKRRRPRPHSRETVNPTAPREAVVALVPVTEVETFPANGDHVLASTITNRARGYITKLGYPSLRHYSRRYEGYEAIR